MNIIKDQIRKISHNVQGAPVNNNTSKADLTFCCPAVSSFFLAFPFHHIDDQQVAAFCCELSLRFPSVPLEKTGKETIRNLMQMRSRFIAEGSNNSSVTPPFLSDACINCPQYQLGPWKNKEQISMIHISMTPAPCQCRCIYCEVIQMNKGFLEPSVQESYRRAFDALEYADARGLIAPDAQWMISSGEITIHPFKDRILSLVKNRNATFFTNAFLFDEKIGNNLSKNSKSKINLSIDSGTPKTWLRIKQVDNFEQIVGNLRKYRAGSSKGGQIELKYILLPGINNFHDDYMGVIKLMKELDIPYLIISRERRNYELTDTEHEELLQSAGTFLAELMRNGLEYKLHSYAPDEVCRIQEIANKQLTSN